MSEVTTANEKHDATEIYLNNQDKTEVTQKGVLTVANGIITILKAKCSRITPSNFSETILS